jgi:hypothetical protein
MTVVFTATPTIPHEELITALRLTLGRLPATARPRISALTGLTRALALGATPSEARRALLAVDPQLAPEVQNTHRFYSLTRTARGSLLASAGSSVAGAAAARDRLRLQIARRIVGHLLTPIQPGIVSRKVELNARVAVTIIGLAALHGVDLNGMDGVLCSRGWLGLQVNHAELTAGVTLRALQDLGWIRKVATVGGTPRWRVATLTAEEDEVAWLYADTVDALACGTADPLADLIRTAPRDTWHYDDRLKTRAWMFLVLKQTSHLPAGERLGLGRQSIVDMKRAINTCLPGLADEQPINEALDQFQRTSLAEFVKGDRELELGERSAAWREALAAERVRREEAVEDRKFAFARIRDAEKHAKKLPLTVDTPEERAAFETWMIEMRRELSPGGRAQVTDPGLRNALRDALTMRLERAGYSAAVTEQVVGYVVPDAA